LAGGRLGIGIDDERDPPGIVRGCGKMERQRRFAGPALLTAIVVMSDPLHVYMATKQQDWQAI